MHVLIVDRMGGRPLKLPAAQIVVYNDAGTPIMIAGEYGPAGAIKVAHAQDADFNATLRGFGHGQIVVVAETVRTAPPPPGATLVAGPGT